MRTTASESLTCVTLMRTKKININYNIYWLNKSAWVERSQTTLRTRKLLSRQITISAELRQLSTKGLLFRWYYWNSFSQEWRTNLLRSDKGSQIHLLEIRGMITVTLLHKTQWKIPLFLLTTRLLKDQGLRLKTANFFMEAPSSKTR